MTAGVAEQVAGMVEAVEIDGVLIALPDDGRDPVAWAYACEEAAETDEELAMSMTAWKIAALVLDARAKGLVMSVPLG